MYHHQQQIFFIHLGKSLKISNTAGWNLTNYHLFSFITYLKWFCFSEMVILYNSIFGVKSRIQKMRIILRVKLFCQLYYFAEDWCLRQNNRLIRNPVVGYRLLNVLTDCFYGYLPKWYGEFKGEVARQIGNFLKKYFKVNRFYEGFENITWLTEVCSTVCIF